jgi:hypothetical protein
VSEAAASRNRKSVQPIRAAKNIYSAGEENVRRKAADATCSLCISGENVIANQKTEIIYSALDISSISERRRGQSQRALGEEAGKIAGIFQFFCLPFSCLIYSIG